LTTFRLAAFGRARSTIPRPPPTGHAYFPALDGIRAVAFLMVFANHYFQLPWGWMGVDVFFVLSGFLITGILFDTRDLADRVRSFYVRRTLRIVPLYYGLMLGLVALYPIFRWDWSWAWLVWPAYLGNFVRGQHISMLRPQLQTLANGHLLSRAFPRVQLNFGHFWSLCVEEQFYLVWPWIVFWVRDRKKLLWVCLACVAVCPLLRVLGGHTLPRFMLEQEVLYRWTPFRVDALLLGGSIALARRGPSPCSLLMGARVAFTVLFGVLLRWLIFDPAAHHTPLGYVYPRWRFSLGLTFIDLLAACSIVMALEYGSLTFRFFNLRPLRWLGRISYGAYVFHDILHVEFIRLVLRFHLSEGSTSIAVAGLAFACTLVLAWASFRWFETPFIQLKDRLTGRSVRGEVAQPEAIPDGLSRVA